MRTNFSIISIFIYFFGFSQSKKDIYDKFLNDGAYKYSYYHPKFQQYIDSALVYLPKDSFLWQQKAMPFFKRKKYEVGMAYINQAVKYDDQFKHYLAYRGFIKCIFQRAYNDAIKDFDVLIDDYDRGIIMDHSYYFYKSICLLQLNKLNEAEQCLKKSFQLSENRKVDLHYLEVFYMGIIYYEKEEYEKAISKLDECLKQYPQFSDALFYKAESYYYLHKKEKAIPLFILSEENLAKGYTINEDNIFYEEYPYQIKKWMIENYKIKLDIK